MSGVPEGEKSDAGGHDRTSREEFRAQVQARKADLERQFEASKASTPFFPSATNSRSSATRTRRGSSTAPSSFPTAFGKSGFLRSRVQSS